MSTSDPYELALDCKPGDLVRWETADGKEHVGRLRSWDDLTAIVETEDGGLVAV